MNRKTKKCRIKASPKLLTKVCIYTWHHFDSGDIVKAQTIGTNTSFTHLIQPSRLYWITKPHALQTKGRH